MKYARRAMRWLKIPGIHDENLYLINDTFTTDRAAGAANDTYAEPGPGRRLVTDTTNRLSISSGNLILSNQAGNEDPRYGVNVPVTRLPGRILSAQLSLASSTTGRIGWGLSESGQNNHGVAFNSNGLIVSMESQLSGSRTLASWSASTDYRVWVILRANGHLIIVQGGAWVAPALLWLSNAASNTPQYIKLSQNSTGTVTYAFARVPVARWLPTPFASDGFSSWGTTDGLGHAEGIVGGLGSGGSGLTWTQNVGVWSAVNGKAVSTLVAGRAIATVDPGITDVIVTVKMYGGNNSAAISARYTDESNRLELRHTGIAVQFVKVVGGVNTTLIDSANTFVEGAEMRLISTGQAHRVYYNNALIGSEQTIADAVINSGTRAGIRNAHVSNSYDDFTVYARGTGGEYAALDNY